MDSIVDFDGYAIVNTGGISLPVTSILLPAYIILDTDCVVVIPDSNPSPNINITTPLAATNIGKLLIIKNKASGVVTLDASPLAADSVTYLVSTGSSWEDITP